MKKLLILASMMFVFGGCSESVGGSGDGPDDGKVSVAFALPGIGIESSVGGGSTASLGTRTGAAVPLAENVTVRVVAYERKGTLAELSSDEYIDEATYIAVKEGDAIVLKPCSVSFDASTGRISAVSTSAASPLRLMAGTYDFYAITPALQLERDGSGKKPVAPAHASVFHGDDYASSLTEGVEVLSSGSVRQPDPANPGSKKTLTDGKVELSVLDRKCALINFSITRKAENVSKVVIDEVILSKIAHSPVERAVLCRALSIGANDCDYEFPEETFIKGKEAYQYSVIDEVLPKSDAPFDLKMKVTFNDAPDATELSATIPSMAFAADVKYNFNLVLRGGSIILLLQITPWNTPVDWDSTDIGGYPGTVIEVGEWGIEWTWSTGVGGYPILVPSVVTDWTPNPDWDTDLGGYLSIGFGLDGWKTDGNTWSMDSVGKDAGL